MSVTSRTLHVADQSDLYAIPSSRKRTKATRIRNRRRHVRTVAEAATRHFGTRSLSIWISARSSHVAIEMFLNEATVLGDWGTTDFYLYRPPTRTCTCSFRGTKSETMPIARWPIFITSTCAGTGSESHHDGAMNIPTSQICIWTC
jgi:hypothetical protein